jgi:hypothetical protein
VEWGLEHISSLELSEWQGFELLNGPLNTEWSDEVAAATHEQLQRLARIQGAAHFTDKKHRKNPVPEPKHYPRPHEMFDTDDPDRDMYDAAEDEQDPTPSTFGSSQGGDDGGDDH